MCKHSSAKYPALGGHHPRSIHVLLGLVLYSVASVCCVLGQRSVWVKLNPSAHEGLVQKMDATSKSEGSLYIFAKINSSLIGQ